MSDPRETIARAIMGDSSGWAKTAADAVLAALDAAGLEVTEKTSQWEWGVRDLAYDPSRCASEEHARNVAASYGIALVRRRPAGAWEVAP